MVRTRFAPSPTGYLHIGGVRTALYNWLYARQHGGQFLLRIDDTDQQRNIQEALQPILDGFRWLGIDWDEGPDRGGPYAPYFQSQRADRYQAAVERLLASGAAYRDYARPEEIQAERAAAEQEKRQFVYSRRWKADSDAAAAAWAAEGRQAVVRLNMPRDGHCRFHDLIRGDLEFAWSAEQDHVVQRADGSVLYHLASVVDDEDFRITHVIRAEEHLSNTPRQVFIAQSLGYTLPQYAHLPYVAEPGSRNKLSKRKLAQYLKNPDFKKLYDHGQQLAAKLNMQLPPELFNPVVVDFYRDVGYLPDAILNYLLLLGWSLDDKTEDFSRAQMIEHFSLDRVHKAPASFDPQKLWAFQQRAMQQLPVKQKVAMVLPYLQRLGLVSAPPPCDVGPRLRQVVEAAGDRLKVAGDILEFTEFFVPDDQLVYDEAAFEKRIRKPGAVELLDGLRGHLLQADPFDTPTTERVVHDFVGQRAIKIGDIIHALRVAITGKSVGLGMFEALAILGREACDRRLQRAIERARRSLS
ncbi:MAG: glutamate--tRNA ligase [Pirellulaceae bacterium]